jgi:hypothetical protein
MFYQNNNINGQEQDESANIDDEWRQYLLTENVNCSSSLNQRRFESASIWGKSLETPIGNSGQKISSSCIDDIQRKGEKMNMIEKGETANFSKEELTEPICEDLYISTKTKVLFFNMPIDIHTIFWKIPIIEYWKPCEGILKKQMKIVSKSVEEYQEYCKKLETVPYYVEHVIKQINNPEARSIKFKDERKITIGISKKDIMNYRGKIKNAFYNCFALIFRFMYEGAFREIHVKIFNTGKMEIPGVLNNQILDIIKRMILDTIQPYVDLELCFVETNTENNILINSNFNCGYYINLERLYGILRSEKYRIESAYEPCSYPGVKCKYYFNNNVGFDVALQNGQVLEEDRSQKMSELGDNSKYTQISFMIFRTGSCLIVGNCNETILQFVFAFIKQFLANEYLAIRMNTDQSVIKTKKTKIRKKTVYMSNTYFNESITIERK